MYRRRLLSLTGYGPGQGNVTVKGLVLRDATTWTAVTAGAQVADVAFDRMASVDDDEQERSR
eukprot:COSAG01_NODE_3828_length_5655_cov_3.721742_10_plen_62_part_00